MMSVAHPGVEDSQREERLVILTPDLLILRSPSERLLESVETVSNASGYILPSLKTLFVIIVR